MNLENGNAPSVEDFGRRHSRRGSASWLRALPVMVPTLVPVEVVGGKSMANRRSNLKGQTRRLGIKNQTVTWNGELWVLRLPADTPDGGAP